MKCSGGFIDWSPLTRRTLFLIDTRDDTSNVQPSRYSMTLIAKMKVGKNGHEKPKDGHENQAQVMDTLKFSDSS